MLMMVVIAPTIIFVTIVLHKTFKKTYIVPVMTIMDMAAELICLLKKWCGGVANEGRNLHMQMYGISKCHIAASTYK